MRISDWSADVYSSDLNRLETSVLDDSSRLLRSSSMARFTRALARPRRTSLTDFLGKWLARSKAAADPCVFLMAARTSCRSRVGLNIRSEEHTSELQSLMRISYAVFCLKKNKKYNRPIEKI